MSKRKNPYEEIENRLSGLGYEPNREALVYIAQKPSVFLRIEDEYRGSMLAHMFAMAYQNADILDFFAQNPKLIREVINDIEIHMVHKKYDPGAVTRYANYIELLMTLDRCETKAKDGDEVKYWKLLAHVAQYLKDLRSRNPFLVREVEERLPYLEHRINNNILMPNAKTKLVTNPAYDHQLKNDLTAMISDQKSATRVHTNAILRINELLHA